jgi:DNA-binding PadR family transcriptional regulator
VERFFQQVGTIWSTTLLVILLAFELFLAFRFQHGTLYPILHKLESQGLISGDWLDEPSRRRRKRYQLTDAGREYLQEQIAGWRSFVDTFYQVVGEAEK